MSTLPKALRLADALEELDAQFSHTGLCGEAAAELRRLHEALETEQEPVAWRWKERVNGDFDNWVVTFSEPPPYAVEQQPLYTAPPAREWVGLTDDDYEELLRTREWGVYLIEAVENKLKEKNT